MVSSWTKVAGRIEVTELVEFGLLMVVEKKKGIFKDHA